MDPAVLNTNDQTRQESSARLMGEALEALAQGRLAEALDFAGRAHLSWDAWREPYCLIARVCFCLGDIAVANAYLELARRVPLPGHPVLDEALYDEAELDLLIGEWRTRTKPPADGSASTGDMDGSRQQGSLRVVAGGDVMLGRQMPGRVGLRGAVDPLAGLADGLKEADLAMVNLETCVSTLGDFIDKGGRQPYYYHCLPEMLDVLSEAGVQGVCTGNNHAGDFGPEALAQQAEILEASGFVHFGAGPDRYAAAMPRYVRADDRVVALIGIETETPVMRAGDTTPGIHYAPVTDMASALAGVIAVARAHADIVIVSPHWGPNWEEVPSPDMRTAARQLVDLGADAILGHSAHILQGVEFHAGRPIVYDMGTLLFDRVVQGPMQDSALIVLTWESDGGCRLTARPVRLRTARATWARGEDFERICDLILRLSRSLNEAQDITCDDKGLHWCGTPTSSPLRQCLSRLDCPAPSARTRPHVPDSLRRLRSNLLYGAMPQVADPWPTPLHMNAGIQVLASRFASPVRPGRGFVCEVYFRAAAPARPRRLEARVLAVDEEGREVFAYTHPVAEGIHPPAHWHDSEIICDRVVVRPVQVVPEGTYHLHWHLRDLGDGGDIPIGEEHPRRRGNQIYLGDLTISAEAPNGVAGVAAPLRLARLEENKRPAFGAWKGRVAAFWTHEAGPWVRTALGEIGVTVPPADPDVVRDRSAVLVVRVGTAQGTYYFKALESRNSFEPRLLQALAARWPDRVPSPLAIDAASGWMLTPDCGPSLLAMRDRRRRQSLFRDILPKYAELQIESCQAVDKWLAMGVPDRRVDVLPSLLEALLLDDSLLNLGKPVGLQSAERREALDLLPYFRSCCDTLAAEPFSVGLDHGDLHLGNILVAADRQTIFDWDTAWVTHPFCSMLLPYDARGLRDTGDLAAMAPVADAYLAPWQRKTERSTEDLTRTLHRALWVAHIVRALLWTRHPGRTEVSVSGRKQTLVAKWIRLWIERRPLLMEREPMSNPDAEGGLGSPDRPPQLATPDNPLLLDIPTIAAVTGGTWCNLPADALITGVTFNRKYLLEGSAGNLMFPLNNNVRDESFGPANVKNVCKTLDCGAVAAVVPLSAEGLPEGLPLLKVDALVPSLKKLGLYVRDHLFSGKRVLVTGTEGKTGFKNMLHHVLSPQIATHAVTNSSNLDFSIYASLASIRRRDRIAILEAAGTQPGRCARRSLIVQPHVFVITEVGNEHINFHGSQQAVIESKADIVTGLVEGGYGLLNADSRNYGAVRKAVLSRRRVPLLLFGSAAGCNGRLLSSVFENNGWTVTADIEDQRVVYRVPLLGDHAPLASVSVLLAAYYLGADVTRAAADFADYQPYESQGVLRRIPHQGGDLLCYDNSSRASVLSYESALGTAARLRPLSDHGKRVAVIGQMIFLGDESETWHARLAEWVDEAHFDKVILVGRHTEVTYAHLADRRVVVKRFPDYDRRYSDHKQLQELIDVVDEVCAPGDLLFIKGEVDELGKALRSRQRLGQPPPPLSSVTGREVAPARGTDVSSVLGGLSRLELSDLGRYRQAIDQTQRTTWQHYFPFIYLLGQSGHTQFLVEEDSGSFCIYRLQEHKGKQELSLFLLPMPFQPAVLERCIERIKAFNRADRASLFRVDASDVEQFRTRKNTRIASCPEEYVYAPANYLDLSGKAKKKLRHAININLKRDDLEVADYLPADADECKRLLEVWGRLQREKYGKVLYSSFTLACLDQYDRFPRTDLFGKVVKLNGQICSFGFAGEMRRGMGNLFIGYSDLRVPGLNRFSIYCRLREMEHLDFANASHAGDAPGLAVAKQALVPAFMHRPYQVYAG